MKTRAILLAAAAALTLSACATATPYQPAGMNGVRGGYAEQRIDQNRYRISFSGNSVTSREQVEMSLLFRAAELTAEQGYDWFSTDQRATDRDVQYRRDFDPFYADRYSFWGPRWRYYNRGAWSPWGFGWPGRSGWDRPYEIREIDRFEATAEIVMGRGPKPAGNAEAFDAREVIANLGPRINRPM